MQCNAVVTISIIIATILYVHLFSESNGQNLKTKKISIMALTTKLNYQRLMALEPTIYSTITNKEGQVMDLVEHPIKGDEYPVIILYHAEKIAVCSDFYDTEDMEHNSDYQPVYMYGEMNLRFEIE